MKKTTSRIIEAFPVLEDKILTNEHSKELTDLLNPIEQTFLKLGWFFENPVEFNFNLSTLYKDLENEWLDWALELITQFFREDTHLIQQSSYAIVKDGWEYLNQSQFATFLTQSGLKYDRAKVKNYYDRGKIPEPDLVIGGTKYWRRSTAKQYADGQKKG